MAEACECKGAADFRITDASGATHDVTVKGLTTVGP